MSARPGSCPSSSATPSWTASRCAPPGGGPSRRWTVPPGSPDSALWARVPGHLTPSAATLAIFGDYVSGAVSQPIGRRAMGRSLDNTLRMVQLKPTEWVLCDIRIHALVGGYGQGIAFLWSEEGDLLATASQSIAVRLWPERCGTLPANRARRVTRHARAAKLCRMARHPTTRNRRRPSARITARRRRRALAVLGRRHGIPGARTLRRRTTTDAPSHCRVPLADAATTTTHAAPPPRRRTTTTTTPGRRDPVRRRPSDRRRRLGDARLPDPLKTSIPGINVDASVSRQWSDGESRSCRR